VQATTHDPADVSVFDMKGNRLSPKAWKELFKNDVHALVSHDGKLPNPRELTLFKQDTLLVVLPSVTPTSIYQVAPGNAPTPTPYYIPSTPALPPQPAPAVLPPQSVRPAAPPVAPRAPAPGSLIPPPPLPGSLPPDDLPPTPTTIPQ